MAGDGFTSLAYEEGWRGKGGPREGLVGRSAGVGVLLGKLPESGKSWSAAEMLDPRVGEASREKIWLAEAQAARGLEEGPEAGDAEAA